jgi:hypothetical protein
MNQSDKKAVLQQLADDVRENRIMREFQILIPKHRFSAQFCELTSIMHDKAELEKLASSARRNLLLEEIDHYLNPLNSNENTLFEQLKSSQIKCDYLVQELKEMNRLLDELTQVSKSVEIERDNWQTMCENMYNEYEKFVNLHIPDDLQSKSILMKWFRKII